MSSYLPTPRKSTGTSYNPFRTYSNHIYPKNMREVRDWALWLWDRNQKYRNAITKVVTYFVSALSITQDNGTDDGSDAAQVDAFDSLLTDDYNLMELIVNFGLELAALGNVFISAENYISRSLMCPNDNCGWTMSLDKLEKGVDYKWEGFEFVGTCPRCGKEVKFKIHDTATTGPHGEKIRFVFRNMEDIRFQYNQLTQDYKYLYKVPEDVRSAISRGDTVYLEKTPKVFLDACREDKLVEFPADHFYSARTRTLSALDTYYKGWGTPLFMASFDNLVSLQTLNKFNEAVVHDYIAPVRLLSPQAQNLGAGVDPNRPALSGNTFRNLMSEALRRTKENPTTWVVSPVPVQYQMLGGEAKQLAPVELMDWYVSEILSDMNIPQEFRQSTFQVAAPSMGMRLFERQWIHFAKSINGFAMWASNVVADAHNIENMVCKLDMTSFVEDDMNKQIQLQLMQGGLISKTKVLKRIGIDYAEELKQKSTEEQLEAEAAQTQQVDMQGKEMLSSVLPPAASVGIGAAQMNIQQMQAAAQGGDPNAMPAGPAAPAAPTAPGGAAMPFNQGASQSASIEQLYSEAQQMAQELYSQPYNVRRQQLATLKQTDPTRHAIVKQLMADMSQQVASDAVAQSRAPQQ